MRFFDISSVAVVVTSMQFVKIHFERIEADSVFVGKTCEECTDELHCLND